MCMCVWTGYMRVHIHVCTYCIANISVATTSSVRIHNMQTRIELSVGLSRAGPKQRGLHNSTPHTDHMLHKLLTAPGSRTEACGAGNTKISRLWVEERGAIAITRCPCSLAKSSSPKPFAHYSTLTIRYYGRL